MSQTQENYTTRDARTNRISELRQQGARDIQKYSSNRLDGSILYHVAFNPKPWSLTEAIQNGQETKQPTQPKG